MNGEAIGRAVVVGDGIAAWTSAVALARRVPGLAVTLVGTSAPSPELADMIATTPPSSRDFHADLGLDDDDIVARTRGAWRLGTAVALKDDHYIRAYGPSGDVTAGLPFATAWASADPARFDLWSPGAQLGSAGRMPSESPLFANVGIGTALDPRAYGGFMASYARHSGVATPNARLAGVARAGERVVALTLDDGGTVTADVYIDATGAARRVIGPAMWHDWSAWLPANRIVRAAGAPVAALPTIDAATRVADGWHVAIALPERTDHLLVYPAGQIEDAAAIRALAEQAGNEPSSPVMFATGRLDRAWIGNVVAIGDAQACVGPIDAAPLQLLHAQIDGLVRWLPGRDLAGVELAEFNREAAQQSERLRDFQIAHAPAVAPPATLADTLARFAGRGRWRQRDGELADRDDWIAVMAGTGLRPRTIDAVARGVDRAHVAREMNAYRQCLAAAVADAPLHRAILSR